MQNWQCRWSPTLGELEDTHQNIWGTKDYEDLDAPTVFFGLYGLPDFYTLWRHRGYKAILWAGSDIQHFIKGYWLEDGGAIKLCPKSLAKWINKHCDSFVENEIEQYTLKLFGIESIIAPSFLGDVNQFTVNFKPGNKLYTSISGDNIELYGWDKIPALAEENPDIEFHLYGNTIDIVTPHKNVIVHGRVPKEQMNDEIKEMQGALRLTSFDGFSEILAKSVLMGQWPVSLIKYPHMLSVEQISSLPSLKLPNLAGREHYISTLNDFIWNQK
jgi:hypothetical protein